MGDLFKTFEGKKAQFEGWLKTQSPAIEIGITTATSALQGGVLGYTLGMVNQNLEKQAANMPNRPPTMAAGSFSGPPKVLALNLAVFTAVQGGLTLAVKKYRGEVEPSIQTSMIGMLGAGMALSLTTNLGGQPAPPGQVKPTTPVGYLTDAVRTGVLFAAFNGAFITIGNWFTGKNSSQDVNYYHTVGMLTALGLEKYESNFRKGLLTDDCLTLLTASALEEVKVPPGPRLKILNYVDANKAHMAAFAAQQQVAYNNWQQQGMSLALPPPK